MTREISGPSVTRGCDSEGPGTRAFGTLYIHTQVTVRGAGTPLISNQSKHNPAWAGRYRKGLGLRVPMGEE